jgi:putative N6-adenine-specific DNA methylase
MKNIQYVATCLFGLEKFVGEEIDALGYKRTETIDGRVYFEGDITAIPRCNLHLRCAERVYILIGECSVSTFDHLFEGTKALPWEEWIDGTDAFPVKGHSVQSTLTSIPDCQKIIKKAIVERMKIKYAISWFPETGIKKQISFFILRDKAAFMLDTSGEGLYKRGYRKGTNEAPLRETLASAMAAISRPRYDVLFWDPLCGSGTIPIEAALRLSHTAPGLFRTFSSEQYRQITSSLWKQAREEARDLITHEPFEIYGSDIDPNVLEFANQNARNAGMSKWIHFFKMDVRDITTRGKRGTIVTNPPYGERLLDVPAARALLQDMGKAFSTLQNWQIYIISSDEEFEKYYGKKADKARKLYNGMIRCQFFQYYKNPKQGKIVNKM